uniref:ParA family protein n=1 Tax=Shewanella algae TaxID=38313 RepID=UPI000B343DEA
MKKHCVCTKWLLIVKSYAFIMSYRKSREFQKMAVILLANKKGGCGKSMTAYGLAVAAAHKGKKVCLVDCDTNETCHSNVRRRNDYNEQNAEQEAKQVPFIKSELKRPDDNIAKDLQELDTFYDVVVVDTGGYENRAFKTGITVADVIYMPFQPCFADMEQLAPTIKVIAETEMFIRNSVPDYSIDARLLVALSQHNGQDLIKSAKEEAKSLLPYCSLSSCVIGFVKAVQQLQPFGLALNDAKHPKRAMYELLLSEALGERSVAYQRGTQLD